MATTPNIIVNTPKKERNLLDYVFGTLFIVGAGIGGKMLYDDYRSKKAAGELNTPEKQIASKIYNAHHWYGDNEGVVFEAAKEISEKKLAWKDVSKSFSQLYSGANIDEYLNFLDADEKARFFQIINLSTPADPGKPPAQSTLTYDTVKNVCIAIASKGTNIRKSPEVIDNGGYLPGLSIQTNIVGTAQINTVLGLMSGNYRLSPDGKVGFIEISMPVHFGTGKVSNRNVWVAGSNVEIKQFSRANTTEKAKGYAYLPKAFILDGNKYNSAKS